MNQKLVAACILVCALGVSAHAQDFKATLNGAQERPTPVVSNGTGNATASFNPGNNMLTVHVDFSGLNSNAQDAHIHCCTTTEASIGVALGFTTAGFPFGVTSGSYDHAFDLLNTSTYTATFLNNFGGGTAAGARDALLFAMGATDPMKRAYFNIHTQTSPGGEIRGNIMPVPEPAAAMLLLLGIAAASSRRRGARKRPPAGNASDSRVACAPDLCRAAIFPLTPSRRRCGTFRARPV